MSSSKSSLQASSLQELKLNPSGLVRQQFQIHIASLKMEKCISEGMHISEYWWGNLNNHDPIRDRKLFLNKKELKKIERKVKETGLTIIVIKVFINDRGLAKAEIAISKGKKEYDKRETLKRKDATREMDRMRKV